MGTMIERIGTTIIEYVYTVSNDEMEREANITSSNIILNDTGLDMILAFPPSYITLLEVYLSSPRSMK